MTRKTYSITKWYDILTKPSNLSLKKTTKFINSLPFYIPNQVCIWTVPVFITIIYKYGTLLLKSRDGAVVSSSIYPDKANEHQRIHGIVKWERGRERIQDPRKTSKVLHKISLDASFKISSLWFLCFEKEQCYKIMKNKY